MPRHPLGRLDGFLEGSLTGRRRRRVAQHLADCPYCANVAQERARVIAAARRVHRPATPGLGLPAQPVRAGGPGGAPSGGGSAVAPEAQDGGRGVMAARGVPGRLVVGALGVGVLAVAALGTLWVAGDPSDAPVSRGLADAGTIVATAEAEAAAGTAADSSSWAAAAAAAPSATALPAATLRDLRRHGWAVPSLQGAGLQPLDMDVADAGDVIEVAVDWGDSGRTVHVRECRSTTTSDVPRACPGQDGAPTTRQGTLPIGVGYSVTADDGSDRWTATLPIGQARYVVTSDLPRERVEQLLSMMVVSDRSGVADDLSDPDEITDRLERGLSRLLGASVRVAAPPAL